jgi:hypothetical protein
LQPIRSNLRQAADILAASPDALVRAAFPLSLPRGSDGEWLFLTDQIVPENGVYAVSHTTHKLAREVTLVKDQRFPRCAQCHTDVQFQPIRLAPDSERRGSIVLYEIPELDDAEPLAA